MNRNCVFISFMVNFECLLAIASWAISCNSFSPYDRNQGKTLAPELNILVRVSTTHKLSLSPISKDQVFQVLVPGVSYPRRIALVDPSESLLEKMTVVVMLKKNSSIQHQKKISLLITNNSFLWKTVITKELEWVQEKATKMVSELEQLSYRDRLKELGSSDWRKEGPRGTL